MRALMSGDYAEDEVPPEFQGHEELFLAFARQTRDKFKTEMCRNWLQVGTCRYGDKCQFAHGLNDMRSRRLPSQCESPPPPLATQGVWGYDSPAS